MTDQPTSFVTSTEVRPEYHEVVIVGAGVSGIAMACQLKRKQGITDIRILDKESAPAGTWQVNTYPGCGCDVPAPMYSFSFRQKTDWSSFFPKQQELRDYFQTVTAEFDLGDRMHLNTVVKEARFDKVTGLWHVWTEDLNGRKEKHHYVSKIFISAVGGLSQPNECTIDGHESFKGPLFHSARWDYSADLKGKNVIVVGNGCSATQFMPIIAKDAKQLTQFCRSKHWYAPVPKDPFRYLPGLTWAVKRFPVVRNTLRFIVWCVLESHFTIVRQTFMGRMFRAHWEKLCTQNVVKNAPKEYHDLLLPKGGQKSLIVGCKRRILDETYLPSLHRPNVRLEADKLVRIEPDAVVTADGRRLPADVIILATGFATQRNGFPMYLYDKNGEEMREHWDKYGDGSQVNYRSTLVPGFTNYMHLVAANSATGHMSLIFTSECQVNYILEISKPILAAPRPTEAAIAHLPGQPSAPGLKSIPTVEVKLEAELSENRWIQKKMYDTVFSTGCGSWYVDKTSGRVTAMSPTSQVDFMIRSTFPDFRDLTYTGIGGAKVPKTLPLWKRFGSGVLGLGRVPDVPQHLVPTPPGKVTKKEV